MLVGKYIPNLVAKSFEVSREYAQLIYDQTSSPRLDKVLKKWDHDNWASAEQRQTLAYIILVEFKLLSRLSVCFSRAMDRDLGPPLQKFRFPAVHRNWPVVNSQSKVQRSR